MFKGVAAVTELNFAGNADLAAAAGAAAEQATDRADRRRPRRVVRNGAPTNDLVWSAYSLGNAAVFRKILELYVSPDSVVADVTYGKGAFWREVPEGRYRLRATDLRDGIDCRQLPYGDGAIDCVVLDPPYMHSPGGTVHQAHSAFEEHYGNNGAGQGVAGKYHEAVLELYYAAGREAHRVLRERGVAIVKCQDEVCANRQCFTHIEILGEYQKIGLVAEDLFVVMRNNRPGISRSVRQIHARKNHSYFLVFWKRGNSGAIWKPE